mmetsp:Transcript_24244/g.36169  ORF Transcript_24244/g.36169 Transcript_24244/m.36169 type:complete len:362 (+) Transcript_24244:61-1146(+)
MIDRSKRKKMYNDEQRILRKRDKLLPGNEWYNQQAYRAISQALGRCIRHAADYGTVILMDSRYCNDGAPSNHICDTHRNLPKWMRHHIRNLSKRNNSGRGMDFFTNDMTKEVFGNWSGLKREMISFFQNAKQHGFDVLSKQQDTLERAQQLAAESRGHVFNAATGQWTSANATNSIRAIDKKSVYSAPEKRNQSLNEFVNSSEMTFTACTTVSGCQVEQSSDNTSRNVQGRNIENNVEGAKDISTLGQKDRDYSSKDTTSTYLSPSTNVLQEGQAAMDFQTNSSSSSFASQNTTTQDKEKISTLSQKSEEMFCIVCEECEKNTLLLPCRHLCLCEKCAKLENMLHCPLCRCEIKEKIKVFL